MVAYLRFLARSAITTSVRAKTTAPTTTLKSCLLVNNSHSSHKRDLHASTARLAASAKFKQKSPNTPPVPKTSPFDDPSWRHPSLGFAAADLPHLVYVGLPRAANEDDVKALIIRAGIPDAQLTLYYDFETGKTADFCFLKVADKDQVDTAVAALSRFTLLGSELKAEKFDSKKLPLWKLPSLFAGWLPSPSSELTSRVIRPPITAPPKTLAPLLAEQWIVFSNLPPVSSEDKESRFRMMREFYKKFHQYDVVGIIAPRAHSIKANGWTCKILFGNPNDAKAARKSHVQGSFMDRHARAHTFRGGPDVHKAVWDYRQSLAKDMPDNEVVDLLEKKYKEVYKVTTAERNRRIAYPTPESAVGLKKDASTSD